MDKNNLLLPKMELPLNTEAVSESKGFDTEQMFTILIVMIMLPT